MGDDVWIKAKGRWIIQGHTGPDLCSLDVYSPTLSRDGQFCICQCLASENWGAEIGDITSAFSCGDPLDRKEGLLYCEDPRSGVPGEDFEPGQLIELLETVY